MSEGEVSSFFHACPFHVIAQRPHIKFLLTCWKGKTVPRWSINVSARRLLWKYYSHSSACVSHLQWINPNPIRWRLQIFAVHKLCWKTAPGLYFFFKCKGDSKVPAAHHKQSHNSMSGYCLSDGSLNTLYTSTSTAICFCLSIHTWCVFERLKR